MPKVKTEYQCQSCGHVAPKWTGQCPGCEAWNTLEESRSPALSRTQHKGYAGSHSRPVALADVAQTHTTRISTHDSELDRVLGGGLVPGAVILLGGDPGIGKSTLLLQTLSTLSERHKVLYVSGEESMGQIADRAKRLGFEKHPITLFAETEVGTICQTAQKAKPQILVIDSIQTMYCEEVPGAPGGVSQVRESAAALARFAKQNNVVIFLVGHVTKSGEVAGPRVLEHIVDTVIYMEGQSDGAYRILRSVKNRFGGVNEIGVFAMLPAGLRPVKNPSAIFLSGETGKTHSGSVVTVIWEGTRPLLVELQALLDASHTPNPRRVAVGLEQSRLALLLAVLHRHAGVVTHDQDVFINVVGGVKIQETASDLSAIAAIYSSLKDKAIAPRTVVFGEVGLSGEIRPVPNGQARLQEAAKQGFKHAILPKANMPRQALSGIQVHAIQTVSELMEALATLE